MKRESLAVLALLSIVKFQSQTSHKSFPDSDMIALKYHLDDKKPQT